MSKLFFFIFGLFICFFVYLFISSEQAHSLFRVEHKVIKDVGDFIETVQKASTKR